MHSQWMVGARCVCICFICLLKVNNLQVFCFFGACVSVLPWDQRVLLDVLCCPIHHSLSYEYQQCLTHRLGGAMWDYFSAVNGVEQGGVLSPVLYCVYIDDSLLALSNSDVRCYIGNCCAGALANIADDIVLIAPTATAMHKLLSVCGAYAIEYCISFNASKYKYLAVLPTSVLSWA